MITSLINKVFGEVSEKKVKKITKEIEIIKEFEKKQLNYSFNDIQEKTNEFKTLFKGLDFQNQKDSLRIKDILNNIKHEAFALVRTTCKLMNGKTFKLMDGSEVKWNMIPYDVQLIGGLVIHEGNIAEMKTGEGKTLVATFPAYLNALTGNTVQIVTVNDYLAERDGKEMSLLYGMLGLSTGILISDQDNDIKKEIYKSDIIYATNTVLGFDYLKDNMVKDIKDKVQSPLFFAIIDEVDSILIDEARTPLIISKPDNEPTSKYIKFAALAKKLKKDVHYKIDEKLKTSTLTKEGIQEIENNLHIDNIYISKHYNDLHHIENALKAISVFKKDKDYLVNNGEILIIDEHTGRISHGRRFSNGLHQALEAKEGLEIKQESKTLASITYQNYFRMYWKLAGMTGTAKTEEEEFYKVYGLETLIIPTNKPIARIDEEDLLFKNEKGKFDYVIELIEELHKSGQPILIGTVSVEKSEFLSRELSKKGIQHNVLNAKYHQEEAQIVANAGQKGAITIATNMAGRGTDIKLGEGVKELGGLIILGTEKHETRRIDNQLRGRAGRQGDPGYTQFLISPNDDIMRIFGGDKLFKIFNGPLFSIMPDNKPLSKSKSLTNKVVKVQKQVEGHHFDHRKQILQYDDILNQHRLIIYKKRDAILKANTINDLLINILNNQIELLLNDYFSNLGKDTSYNVSDLHRIINDFLEVNIINENEIKSNDISLIKNTIINKIISFIEFKKFNLIDLKNIILNAIDDLWMEHLNTIDSLKLEVSFDGFAQKDPLVSYKEKAYNKFVNLINEIDSRIIKGILIKENLEKDINKD